jgi:hypothetical protein
MTRVRDSLRQSELSVDIIYHPDAALFRRSSTIQRTRLLATSESIATRLAAARMMPVFSFDEVMIAGPMASA